MDAPSEKEQPEVGWDVTDGCPVDGEPCDVLEAAGVAPEGVGTDMDLLPCSCCRVALAHAYQGLPGTRLGQRERSMLLLAAAPGQEPVVPPVPETGGLGSSYSHAYRKLRASGLVETPWVTVEPAQVASDGSTTPPLRRYGLVLTPLGAALVDRLREVLESGGRITWSKHIAAIAETVQEPLEVLVERLPPEVLALAQDGQRRAS